MRKFTVTAAVLGLAALGLAVRATAAQAADDIDAGPGCDSKWGPRDGRIYAWDLPDCLGTLLPVTDSGDWGPDGSSSTSIGPAATPVFCRARCMPTTWRTAGSATAPRWTTTSVHIGGSTAVPVWSS